MATTITANTQLANSKNDLIISLVQKELAFQAKLLPYFTDYSSFAGKGVKSIYVPKYNSFTVQERPTGVEGDVLALTAERDQILLDKRLYVSWIIDAADEIESSVDNEVLFLQRAAAAHARKIDELLIAKMVDAAIDLGNAPLTYDLVLAMHQDLIEAEADMNQVAMFISPAQYTELFKLNEFKSAEVFGQATIPSGVLGRVMGVPVIAHTGLASNQVFMAEKSAIGYAFQMGPNVARQAEIGWGTTAQRVAVDQKFGCGALHLGEKGAGATKSPLIVGVFGA